MTWLNALPSNARHGNMGIQYPWDPCYEQANQGRKECGQLEGSEEQVVVEEEEEPQEQVQLVVALVQEAIIGVSICQLK